MTFSNIKKFAFPLLAAAVFSACDKPVTTDQLGDSGQNIIRVNTYGGVDANFSTSALLLDLSSPDPVETEFQFEYVGSKVFNQDLTLTVGVDDAKRIAYNATVPVANQFVELPSSIYTISTTTSTIKAGDVFSTPVTLTILDPSQLDPAVSYMVPVTITGVTGGNVSAAPSTGTAYFHIIGNPLAGAYHSNGFFYHPTPASCRAIDEDKTLSPNSPDELFCDLADLGGQGYTAIFKTDLTTNKVSIRVAPGYAGGPYTQWDDALPGSNPGYTPLWPSSAQCNNTYDPATKTFKVRYGYLNTATGYRVTEELITKL